MRLGIWLAAAAMLPLTPGYAQIHAAPTSMTEEPCTLSRSRIRTEMTIATPQPRARSPTITSSKRPNSSAQDYANLQAEESSGDFADLWRYHAANAALKVPPKIVLMGDSITDNWLSSDPKLFSESIIDRGISGDTSAQMLLRFYQDVVALHPQIVHIMAGTNDVAGNTRPSSPEIYKNNICAMVGLALLNRIRVVLAAIPPANRFPWRPDLHPYKQIVALNDWLRAYAAEQRVTFVDYGRVLAAPLDGMKPELSSDGVHPNDKGYTLMRPLLLDAITAADRAGRLQQTTAR